MAILAVTRRRLNDGVAPNSKDLISTFPHIRDDLGAPCVFYSAMEEPEAFFQMVEFPSLEAYRAINSSANFTKAFDALDRLSVVEWHELVPIDKISTLPLEAPVMTVSRCFFKEYDGHPQMYFNEVRALLNRIEAETKPWRYVGNWTIDTTPDCHKWVVFGGWRSKKHHQEFATKLKKDCGFFEGIPEHYDEGTVHRHCWDMEKIPSSEIFETLQGFIPQKITKART
ncbi:uncharacterized protein PV09_03118 [Verruconis gallopava]|uniref:ABM domain-containing protein n=1 Tax=Verruconis gallopava TaxID=253628 RepID=A0A0D2AH91_9PEZI|nr:uncharacterized protein PV09_03118 [Verruconis gallopava]KIW05925.1 hypothetical protein PV09_03118 [Verruconis gallopava]